MHSGSRDRDALLLAARELRGSSACLLRDAHLVEELSRPGLGIGAGHLEDPARRQRQVVEHAQVGEQVERLEDDADLPPQVVDVELRVLEGATVNVDLAGIDRFEPVDAAQERALAGSRWADHDHDLSPIDADGDVVEDPQGAERLEDPPHVDHRACVRGLAEHGRDASGARAVGALRRR